MPPPPTQTPIQIDAIAFQDASGVWIGQCIQYDIVVQAKTLADLPKSLIREVVANICINAKLGRKDLEGIPPAPDKYRAEFDGADLGLSPKSKMKQLDSFRPVQLHDLRVVEAA